MAVIPWSSYTALGAAPATNDILALTDVSDHGQSPQGSTKRMTVANLFTSPHLTGAVVDSGGLTVTAGGLTVTAGGLTVSAGTTAVQALTATSGAFGSSPASSGSLRIPNASNIVARNAANSGDQGILAFDALDRVSLLGGTVTIASTTVATTADLAINTNKFTVAAASGNTVVAGTLAVTGSITGTLGTAAQTNITSVGTLSSLAVTGDITVNTNKLVVTGSSGALASAASVQGITGLLTGVGSAGTGGLFDKNQVAMTGSAVAISSVAQGSAAAFAVVRGTDGTNAFTDLVHYGGNVANPPLSQLTLTGSPTARTYTSASGVLRLSMSSAYTVACCDHRGITLN